MKNIVDKMPGQAGKILVGYYVFLPAYMTITAMNDSAAI